jgi:hypothetical protein
MLKKFFLPVLLLVLVAACKKECLVPPTPPPAGHADTTNYANYSMLAVGNYWVYKRIKVDRYTNHPDIDLGIIDSCYIDMDTIINGSRYFRMMKPYYNIGTYSGMKAHYLKDSLHYTVDLNEGIIFSSQDTSILQTGNGYIGNSTTLTATYSDRMDFNLGVWGIPGLARVRTYDMFPHYGHHSYTTYYTYYGLNQGIVWEAPEYNGPLNYYYARSLLRSHLN